MWPIFFTFTPCGIIYISPILCCKVLSKHSSPEGKTKHEECPLTFTWISATSLPVAFQFSVSHLMNWICLFPSPVTAGLVWLSEAGDEMSTSQETKGRERGRKRELPLFWLSQVRNQALRLNVPTIFSESTARERHKCKGKWTAVY